MEVSVKDRVKEIENKMNPNIEPQTSDESNETTTYTVYKIYSLNDRTKYYISYKKNLKFLSNVILSTVQRYKFYLSGEVKKWCSLYLIVDMDNITIEKLGSFDDLLKCENFISEYMKNNNECVNDIPKQDLVNKKSKIKCEIDQYKEKKSYFKEQYDSKVITEDFKKKQSEYYMKNQEKRKKYCKEYYQRIKEKLKKLEELEKK